MTLEQFNLSDDNQQAFALSNGVCVAGREEGEFKVLLYQLQRFYVEVFYHPAKKQIERWRGFESTEELEPYLQKIPMACLL